MDIQEIKKRFRTYGLSQSRVAETIGVSPTLLSFIFSKKVKPTEETQYKLLRLLKLCEAIEGMVMKRLAREENDNELQDWT